MTNTEKLKAYYGPKVGELDEAVPKDMIKNVNRNVSSGRGQSAHTGSFVSDVFPNTDLANSSVREITPQEAEEEIKKGNYKNLIYIIDTASASGPNQFVTLRQKEDGYIYGSTHFAADVDTGGGKYKNTKNISAKAIGKLADHIYFYDNVDKDPNLLKLRSENPESPNYKSDLDYTANYNRYRGYPMRPYTYGGDAVRGSYPGYDGNNVFGKKDDFKASRWNSSIKQIEDTIKNIKDRIKQRTENGYAVPEYMYDNLRNYERDLAKALNDRKDRQARMRYLSSERDLSKKQDQYDNLKNKLFDAKGTAESSRRELAKAQGAGSDATVRMKNRLKNYKDNLNAVLKEIARLEMQIDQAEEDDAANVGKYQAAVDDALKQVDAIQAEINNLLGKA